MPGLYGLPSQLGIFTLPLTAFWLWMIVDCARNDPEKSTWLWLICVFPYVGAIVYFVARKLPTMQGGIGGGRRRIRALENQVRFLANAYYLTQLGEAYLEAGKVDRALAAFQKALEMEPEGVGALLGCGECLARKGNYAEAVPLLEKSYRGDPTYRMGRSGEMILSAFLERGEDESLREWFAVIGKGRTSFQLRFVEAYLLTRDGRGAEARRMLDQMVEDLRHLPRFNYRREKPWRTRALRLLKQV